MATTVKLLQGTLDLLILKAVSLRSEHGYGILLRIQQISRDALQIQQGSLYPASLPLPRGVSGFRRASSGPVTPAAVPKPPLTVRTAGQHTPANDVSGQ
jgi:hypothetical protein